MASLSLSLPGEGDRSLLPKTSKRASKQTGRRVSNQRSKKRASKQPTKPSAQLQLKSSGPAHPATGLQLRRAVWIPITGTPGSLAGLHPCVCLLVCVLACLLACLLAWLPAFWGFWNPSWSILCWFAANQPTNQSINQASKQASKQLTNQTARHPCIPRHVAVGRRHLYIYIYICIDRYIDLTRYLPGNYFEIPKRNSRRLLSFPKQSLLFGVDG